MYFQTVFAERPKELVASFRGNTHEIHIYFYNRGQMKKQEFFPDVHTSFFCSLMSLYFLQQNDYI